MVRIGLIAVSILFLSGMMSCGPHLQQRDIATIEFASASRDRILDQNEAVDLLVSQITEFLVGEGFEKSHRSTSFGLQPWTGHTQHSALHLVSNDRVVVYFSAAKCCISATFSELETAIGSGEFAATSSDRKRIREVEVALRRLLETNIDGLGYSKSKP